MNWCCENCGWSEINGTPIMCNYTGCRTWRDECCEAWKPKEKETNIVEVVRCKDCKYYHEGIKMCINKNIGMCGDKPPLNWYCADGERK